MFTAYRKSLNDMVFSTSESPEDQPSTGILGRIGYWLSPWRGRASVPPSESDSSSGSFADETGGEDGEESVRIPDREEQETDSNLEKFFPCEEENATQSAHRHCSAESSTRGGGGPKEEELVVCREHRTGQGNEREERGSCVSESGNHVKNVCHLTNLFTSRPEVVWNFDQDPTQPRPPQHAQVQSDKRLHVYLEETSVIHCGKDLSVGQEVVTTTFKKDLHVPPKAKSSSSLAANAELNVRSAAGTQSSDSTVVGVSVKPPEDSQSEPQPHKEQTEEDGMGRKSRKKSRRKSQGDEGGRLSENPAEDVPPSCNSVSSPQSENPTSPTGEACEGPSFKTNPTSQAAPEGGGQIETVCPGDVKQLGNFRNSISVTAASNACEENEGAEMEEESSLYKVERKTETPESKRRSIKVSTCEVKNYSKVLPLNQKQNQLENHQETNAERLTTEDEEKNQAGTFLDSRPHDPKKADVHPKSGSGGIADKISIFERRRLDGSPARTPRSADVSPTRTLTNRFKADLIFSEQRSKSAERHREDRSGFSSPSREKPMTIKERTKKFLEASKLEAEAAQKQVAAKAATSQKSTSKVLTGLTKSPEPDGQDKLDIREQTHANSEITSKPEGGGSDANDGQLDVSEVQPADSLTNETEDQITVQNSISKGEESAGLANSTTSPPKGPSRTGSRSKKKKNREPASPVSIQNTSEDPATKQEHAGNAENPPASKQTAEKVAFPSQEVLGDLSEKQPHTDTKEEERAFDILPNRQEGSPEAPVHRDEPDTPVCSTGTKKTIDSDPAVSPPEEWLSGKHSFALEAKRNDRDNSQTSADQPPAVKQESLAEQPSLGEKLSARLELASKEELGQTTEGQIKEPTFQSQPEDVEVLETADREKTNNAERIFQAKTMEALSSDMSLTKDTSSHSGGVPSDKDGNVQDGQKSETASHLSEETTALPFQTQTASQVETEHREKAVICTMSDTNEAVSGTGADKKPPNIKMASTVPPESLTQSAESPGMERETVVVSVEPQFNSVSVEKPENSLDDSCTHEANAPEPSNSKPFIKAAAAADEGRSSKVTNELSELKDSLKYKTGKDSGTEEHSSKPACEPADTDAGEENRDESAINNSETPQDKVAGEIIKAIFSNGSGKSENPEDKSTVSSIKLSENLEQRSHEGKDLSSEACETEKMAGTAFTLPMQELSLFPNGNLASHYELQEEDKKPKNQTPKTSPKNNNLNPDSVHRLPMKILHVPLGLKTDSSEGKETPSSWLDLDFPKQKPKVQEAKLTSSGSESNLLDTSGELDDEDFVAKIKNLCVPFSHPPRKHHPIRTPQPPFVMPAIREASLEKTFDPEEFMFGLRKKKQLCLDATPSLLADLHTPETKSNVLPARASFAERSLLLTGFKDVKPVKDDDVKEDRDDLIKVKSRLEGSSLYSSLISSNLRGNKNGLQTESSTSEDALPSQAPLLTPLLPPCPTNATKDTLTKQITEEVQASEDMASDSSPPLPTFNDIKLPDYLKKYLPQDPAAAVQSAHGQEEEKTEIPQFTGKMAAPVSPPTTDLVSKPNPGLPDSVASCFPGIPPTTLSTLPDLKQPVTQPHKTSVNGFRKRPGKMVLFENAQFSGQAYEIYRDVADASSLQFSPLISVKVVRGCWLLYERPDFQGRIIALEEGATDLENEWAECGPETEPHNRPPILIGSIRLVVRDHSIPHIDLFTDPEGRGRVASYHDDTIETGTFGIPLTTASIQIHSGVWLVFSDPGFQGMLSVLEAGEYPFPESWGFPSPFVGSLRPLKMGGLKVENPSEVKAVLFEKPGFEGSSLEIDSDIFSFSDDNEANPLKSVGSLKIIGGFWVGYSQPGFEGQQHILEEGEYDDCSDWGGSELLSLRPVHSDFLSPHVKMYSDRDFGKLGVNINLTGPVGSIDETGYGMKTQSVDVTSGVWVFFDEPEFLGKCYVLEKGLYGSPEDWGALQPRVGSAMPVLLDDFVDISKFKVQLFSDPGFRGSVLTLEDSAASLQDGFSVASCKVQAGSWLAFEGQDFTGKMYALEVGSYPDLRAMGCVSKSSSILSLQSIGPEFSLPSITLFERCGLRGKRVLLTDGTVNLLLAGGSTRVQSVLVEGGMWIVYEEINYRGAQILLKPGEIPNWHKFSSWQKIGSLRPLLQKRMYFHLRNRQSGLMMSITGDFDDVKMLRIQETEETGGFEQIWLYQNGHLYCKLFEEYCLSPSGSVTIPGCRVGVSPKFDDQIHQWNITPEGFVRYTLTPDLVLEVKGGHQYDKKHVILNTMDPHKLQQRWDVEIL
ncbi:beta/gamma crystallin domain-containing protein 1 isoform X1 [Oryzias latipes]|uniref:beta/gamma crystallin domain-containing protein 1 isoform X1 n=2 Tax=Oryzias latipes TaxID=8090 RepID=UPI0009DB5A3E|nr:beta/gamma crystallin domain-containing protein 1 isoform X1 [Oryzias latipes]